MSRVRKLEDLMKKRNAALSFGLALLSLTFCKAMFADEPPDNVEGDWTIYSTNIENGSTVVKHVQIAQYGDRITGYFEGPNQSGPIQGEVKGHHIKFSTVTRTVLTFRGQIYGNNMSGEYGIHGKHAPWQAIRPVAVTTAAPAPPSNGVVYQAQPELAPATPAPQAYSQPAPPPPAQNSYTPTPAPLSASQLDALVAPIALYPDSLVAQILAAATFPDEIPVADNWLHQNSNLTGYALAQAVDQQTWDPSVKALTQFPSVLDNLARNMSWSSSLGQAFHYQQPDVMAAVQAMRAKAQAAGTLQSTTQVTVTQSAPNTIVIQPANPQVVYVPQYNPAVVFGAPLVVPFYTPPVAFVGAGITFGSGISIGAFFGGGGFVAGGGFGWGFHAWALNWGGGGGNTIIYNHNTYITNNTWRSTSYNGYHPWGGGAAGTQNRGYYGANGAYHPDPGYHPGVDTHYGPNGGYHPNEYFGPNGGLHPDKPGTNPASLPNGGNNGNHGLIGGNGGVDHAASFAPNREGWNNGGDRFAQNAGYNRSGGDRFTGQNSFNNRDRFGGGQMNRSRFSGDGWGNRAESNRGWRSMGGRQMAGARAPHFSGGGHRR